MTKLVMAAIVLNLLLLRASAFAADWPQILGPERNGRAQGEKLAPAWPEAGPTLKWRYKLGAGYAGPTVVGKQVVVFHRVADVERIEAVNVADGKSLWKSDSPAEYRGGINEDLGPRCVPLIHAGHVYTFGAAGELRCVSLLGGQQKWSRAVYAEYEGDEGYFGAGSTPLVVDDKLLVNVGGKKGSGIVAFALDTGKTVWKATDEKASYSSPTSAVIGGQEHAIFVTRMSTISVDPANGDVRFRFPFGKTGPTVNAATPLVFDNRLFVSASYGVGAQLADVSSGKPEKIWASDNAMSSQYTTCVFDQGYLYGVDGREDIGGAVLRCLEAKSGRAVWSVEGFGVAHVILADGKLLLLKTTGELVLAEASPKAFKKLASARVSDSTTRALPALANGQFYFRDNSRGSGELRCYAVGGER